jgi:15-cis-phytoene desaturase
MGPTVAVLGGGVAGLSAAHELAERGFSVRMFEKRPVVGGKARSIDVPGPTTAGRALPGEHGFRFFAGFYRHVIDTMSRIPYSGQSNGVVGNLTETTRADFARSGLSSIVVPVRFPRSMTDLTATRGFLDFTGVGISPSDALHFINRLLTLLSSCKERRFAEWEQVSWWEFSGAATRSKAYQTFLADGMTRCFVAAKAQQMSARSCGYILLQLMSEFSPTRQMDRVLQGPTNDVWIDPWGQYLDQLGVERNLGAEVKSIECMGGRISGVTVAQGNVTESVEADYYVAALPVEVMASLTTVAMKEADPGLASLDQLVTRWMNGIQLYFENDIPIVHGHSMYMDSPFGLTSISQQQFWLKANLCDMGDGKARGVLSVDISDWETPGLLYGKPAMQLSADQVKDEVLAQLGAHLTQGGVNPLDEAKLCGWFLDPDIVYPNPTSVANLEPLFINTVGSWKVRPEAVTNIENLFLASDYVRTHTDLATMEAANEAARRAVNGILEASGSGAGLCGVWPLQEPLAFAPLRQIDQLRFRLGRKNQFDVLDRASCGYFSLLPTTRRGSTERSQVPSTQ